MTIYEYGDKAAQTVLIQPVDEHDLGCMENEVRQIAELCPVPFRLIAVRVDDWNRDLSPWAVPAVFGREGFGAGAADTLAQILTFCADRTKTYYVGGYSLAGLFALWAAYQTDVFKGVAAASPSMWFPGFTEHMKMNEIRIDTVYLSLGDREEQARNPVMATVGEKIREVFVLLKEGGVNCILEWNKGNHFKETDLRTAKAFAWVMDGQLSHDLRRPE